MKSKKSAKGDFMKKARKAANRTAVMDLPEFKSEKQEAEFWVANPELITAAVRAAYSTTRKQLQAISIRVPVDDLARIKTLGAERCRISGHGEGSVA